MPRLLNFGNTWKTLHKGEMKHLLDFVQFLFLTSSLLMVFGVDILPVLSLAVAILSLFYILDVSDSIRKVQCQDISVFLK